MFVILLRMFVSLLITVSHQGLKTNSNTALGCWVIETLDTFILVNQLAGETLLDIVVVPMVTDKTFSFGLRNFGRRL